MCLQTKRFVKLIGKSKLDVVSRVEVREKEAYQKLRKLASSIGKDVRSLPIS